MIETENTTAQAASSKVPFFDRMFRPELLVLLVVIIALQAITMIQAKSRPDACAAATKAALTDLGTWTVQYQADAYGKAVDTIYQQQLVTSQYQLLAEQALIGLMAACN